MIKKRLFYLICHESFSYLVKSRACLGYSCLLHNWLYKLKCSSFVNQFCLKFTGVQNDATYSVTFTALWHCQQLTVQSKGQQLLKSMYMDPIFLYIKTVFKINWLFGFKVYRMMQRTLGPLPRFDIVKNLGIYENEVKYKIIVGKMSGSY